MDKQKLSIEELWKSLKDEELVSNDDRIIDSRKSHIKHKLQEWFSFKEGPYYSDGCPEGWVCWISVNGLLVFKEYHFGEDAKEITRSKFITSIFTHGIDAARKSLEHLRHQIQSKEE